MTFVIVYTVLFPIVLNTVLGVESVHRDLARAAQSLGASRMCMLWEVTLPGALPNIITGLRNGLGYGWRALIAVEIIVGTSGIGLMMFDARRGAGALESQLIRTTTNSGMRSEARAGAALQLPGAVVRPYARWERTSAPGAPARQSFVGLQATVLPRRSLGPLLSGFWLQGQMEAEGARSVTSAAVSVARNLGQAFRLEVGTRWERAQPAPVFTLSLVSQLAAVRSTSIVTASPGAAETRLDQSIGGSVVWGRVGTAPVFWSEPSLDRGGVGGRVFVDLNGDGLWQPGEPTAPGTRLLVANRWVTADANGRYQLWGFRPGRSCWSRWIPRVWRRPGGRPATPRRA